jgi:tRNA uridine 5-carboxymethylaminomethyl modification enzyme
LASGDARGFLPDRAQSYIGVLVDDLVSRGVTEPYRMFTSRAEYRLSLRADNADERLTPVGLALGCVGPERAAAFAAKATELAKARAFLASATLTPTEARAHGLDVNLDGQRRTGLELLAYPQVSISRLQSVWPELRRFQPEILERLECDAQYAGYLERQERDIAAFRRDEAVALPEELDYLALPGLSAEVRQKLAAHRPRNLGQAARLDGMTPAALTLLLALAKREKVRTAA